MVNIEMESPAASAVKGSNQYLLYKHVEELRRKQIIQQRIYTSKIQLTSALIESTQKKAKKDCSSETKSILQSVKTFFKTLVEHFDANQKKIKKKDKAQIRKTCIKCRQATRREFENKKRNQYQLQDHPLHRQPHLEFDSTIAGA